MSSFDDVPPISTWLPGQTGKAAPGLTARLIRRPLLELRLILLGHFAANGSRFVVNALPEGDRIRRPLCDQLILHLVNLCVVIDCRCAARRAGPPGGHIVGQAGAGVPAIVTVIGTVA